MKGWKSPVEFFDQPQVLIQTLQPSALFNVGHIIRRSSPRLPCRWTLLLSLSPWVVWLCPGRSGPCLHLHHLHAGIVCLLLQNLDRGVRLLRQGRKFQPLRRRWRPKLIYERWSQTLVAPCISGGETAEGAADGDEGTQRDLHGPRVKQVHLVYLYIPDCCGPFSFLWTLIPICLFRVSGISPPPLPSAACASEGCR